MDNLWPLTGAEWRDLSNHTRMSTIQSRTPEKEAKNYVTLIWIFSWKSCWTTHLPFLSSNSNILKVFLKIFPMKMKPTKCPATKKKGGKKSGKKGEERKRKVQCRPELSEPNICVICVTKDESIASGWMHPCVWADEPMHVLWNASVHIKTHQYVWPSSLCREVMCRWMFNKLKTGGLTWCKL